MVALCFPALYRQRSADVRRPTKITITFGQPILVTIVPLNHVSLETILRIFLTGLVSPQLRRASTIRNKLSGYIS